MTTSVQRPPYGAYAAIMGAFAGGLGSRARWRGCSIATRRSTPRSTSFALGAATFKAARTVSHDEVTSFLREPFGALSGRLRWSHGTGGYVYSSPAVWRRLVLVGSYDGSFYAVDAATGDLRWRFRANGPISGAPTVLDGIVYFSTLAERTFALEARTGRLVWTYPDGKYSPAVSDGRRLYLVGYTRLYGLVGAR
jgi:outer membrane protein assembly factor BamB